MAKMIDWFDLIGLIDWCFSQLDSIPAIFMTQTILQIIHGGGVADWCCELLSRLPHEKGANIDRNGKLGLATDH